MPLANIEVAGLVMRVTDNIRVRTKIRPDALIGLQEFCHHFRDRAYPDRIGVRSLALLFGPEDGGHHFPLQDMLEHLVLMLNTARTGVNCTTDQIFFRQFTRAAVLSTNGLLEELKDEEGTPMALQDLVRDKLRQAISVFRTHIHSCGCRPLYTEHHVLQLKQCIELHPITEIYQDIQHFFNSIDPTIIDRCYYHEYAYSGREISSAVLVDGLICAKNALRAALSEARGLCLHCTACENSEAVACVFYASELGHWGHDVRRLQVEEEEEEARDDELEWQVRQYSGLAPYQGYEEAPGMRVVLSGEEERSE
ncbi:hypothetical protein K461DRAFT_296446 [Myriangium duriaei CBS 260.36]|uniref:Uncharacterized protein n=1 Tax=Myriangium duriaei CBS 260.36 TaxID=1168546 RepID=A0A9P4MEK1_9PEZI|nr:hypothetical protein K461DRAFT_296446 [Myriangium duriaei CBS 260.36]